MRFSYLSKPWQRSSGEKTSVSVAFCPAKVQLHSDFPVGHEQPWVPSDNAI